MNTPIDQFHSLLERYRMIHPVSRETQKDILKYRDSDYKKLLKKVGKYSSVLWLAVIVYTGLKKIGIQATLLQSKIIVGVAAAALSAGSVTGTYQGVKYVQKIIHRQESKEERPVKIEKTDTPETIQPRSEPIITVPRQKAQSSDDAAAKKDKQTEKKEREKQKQDGDTLSDVPSL
jgi:hypothetical protein